MRAERRDQGLEGLASRRPLEEQGFPASDGLGPARGPRQRLPEPCRVLGAARPESIAADTDPVSRPEQSFGGAIRRAEPSVPVDEDDPDRNEIESGGERLAILLQLEPLEVHPQGPAQVGEETP
jgi:hypothetical protein